MSAADLWAIVASPPDEKLSEGETLADPTPWARIAAAEALGALRSAESVPELSGLLRDVEPEVRRATVVALMGIGSGKARAAIAGARQDPDWEVRLCAAEALRRLDSLPRDPPSE